MTDGKTECIYHTTVLMALFFRDSVEVLITCMDTDVFESMRKMNFTEPSKHQPVTDNETSHNGVTQFKRTFLVDSAYTFITCLKFKAALNWFAMHPRVDSILNVDVPEWLSLAGSE